jgi:glutamate 5-kinase
LTYVTALAGTPRHGPSSQTLFHSTEAAAGNASRAVAIAAAAQEMSARAGVVVVPKGEHDALVASGSALTPAAVLAMVTP